MNLKSDEFKKFGHEVYTSIQKAGFWVLILVIFGAMIGTYGSNCYFKSTIVESIKLQRMIHNGLVYDIIISPVNGNTTVSSK